jgi:hypothetical protein
MVHDLLGGSSADLNLEGERKRKEREISTNRNSELGRTDSSLEYVYHLEDSVERVDAHILSNINIESRENPPDR